MAASPHAGDRRHSTARKACLYIGQSVALAAGAWQVAQLVSRALAGFIAPASVEASLSSGTRENLAAIALASTAWALLRWLTVRDGDFGREVGRGANWRRAYFYGTAMTGSFLAVLGSYQLLRAVFTLGGQLFTGSPASAALGGAGLPSGPVLVTSLTALLVGAPLATLAWGRAGRLALYEPATEFNALSRVLSLRLTTVASTFVVLAALVRLLQYGLASLMGQPIGPLDVVWENALITPLAALPVALVTWLAAAGALAGARTLGPLDGESADAASVRRLHFYLVAAAALCAFWYGATELLRLIFAVATGSPSGGSAPLHLIARFSLAAALVFVAAPAWWGHWWPEQIRARQPGAAGYAERAFPLRRLYLYGVTLAAAAVVLLSVAGALIRFASWRISDVPGQVGPLVLLAEPLASAFVAAVWWVTHMAQIREDNRLLSLDRAAQEADVTMADTVGAGSRTYQRDELIEPGGSAVGADQALNSESRHPIVVIDGDDGMLGAAVLSGLRAAVPGAALWPIPLGPNAQPAMASIRAGTRPPESPQDRLLGAAVIIAASDLLAPGGPLQSFYPDLMAALAASPARLLLLPPRNPKLRWVAAPDWPMERWIEHAVAEAADIVMAENL